MGRLNGIVLFVCFSLALSQAGASSLEPTDLPSLISCIRISGPLTFCNERVPLEDPQVRERLEKELLLSLWDRPQVILWLKRSTRYLPHIEKMLGERGVPDDLKYVAVAESALRPHVGSVKGAIGFWQFMAYTARKNGLRVDARVDQRRNLFSSTEAAIGFLSLLQGKFGSWTLAVAAYNMGEEGLAFEILEQETEDYYRLYLPLETQRFIFRILSVKLIFSDPERYGFKLEREDYYPPLKFERVHVDCPQEMPIRVIAKAAQTHFKEIKDLNPEIRGHYLARGTHELLIPKGSSEGFQDRYENLAKEFMEARRERVYVVNKGDSLSSIAGRFSVPVAALILWNGIDPSRPIHPGDRLVVFRKELQDRDTETGKETESSENGPRDEKD